MQSNDLLTAGIFGLTLSGVADDDWIVVSASGGSDIDHNGDGTVDPSPTINKGTLHAVAKAADWRNKHLRITPLTELAYRFTEHLFSQIPQDELAIRLQDLARYLIKTDIDGSGTVDWNDILLFNPANPEHRDKLTTSYDWLSTVNDEGHSIIDSLLAGNEKQMLSCMDEIYSYLMTRFPVPDSRYHSVKITLSVFGPGRATSDAPANLAVDSTLAEPVYADHVFLPENESESVTFTATPTQDTKILHWSGCETVSADLSQCTVPLNKSQSVVINFGRTATTFHAPVHDLTRTTNMVDVNTISVLIPDDMADMIAEMATAAVDDFVVSGAGEGFLRRITGINQVSTTYYILDTVEAALDEVISQGTGQLFKQMENGDLEGYTTTTSTTGTVSTTANVSSEIDGVQVLVSDDPKDTSFKIVLGTPESVSGVAGPIMAAAKDFEQTTTVTLFDDGQGNTLEASGTISLGISLDTAFDYKWREGFAGLHSFKFIVIVDAEESIELTASSELAKFNLVKINIATYRFGSINIMIGAVPVVIIPTVDVYFFANGKVSAEVSYSVSFEQTIEGGLLYNENTGFSRHESFSSDRNPILPTATISASIKGGVEVSPALKIYGVTGPALPLEAYAKMKASLSTEIFGTCTDMILKNSVGVSADFKWDMSASSKIGEMLHLDQLEDMTRFNIYSKEWTVAEWPIFDSCPEYVAGSHLVVEGDGIFSTIAVGDPNGLATTLTVENIGDETLHWNTSGIPPEVQVHPTSGTL
ncbi:MAG: hypothetical protein U9P36_10725, partial [Thermodesulfobacteriota bacterium]|nr:hypothetical protein [Thermodesulfobacteriota bacterium]